MDLTLSLLELAFQLGASVGELVDFSVYVCFDHLDCLERPQEVFPVIPCPDAHIGEVFCRVDTFFSPSFCLIQNG